MKFRSSPSMPIVVGVSNQTVSIHRLNTVPNASNTGEAYVVAGDDVWLDGIFDSKAAALAAASLLTVDELVDLWSETKGETVAATPEEDPILDIDDVAGVLNARQGIEAPATVDVTVSHLRDDDVETVARAMAIFSGNDPDRRQLDRPDGPYLWQLHAEMAKIAIEAYEAPRLQRVVTGSGPKRGHGGQGASNP